MDNNIILYAYSVVSNFKCPIRNKIMERAILKMGWAHKNDEHQTKFWRILPFTPVLLVTSRNISIFLIIINYYNYMMFLVGKYFPYTIV